MEVPRKKRKRALRKAEFVRFRGSGQSGVIARYRVVLGNRLVPGFVLVTTALWT